MERFQQIITDLIALFDEYLPLEQEKLRAVQEDDVATVEDCMRKEQAIVLKLRGLEQKREEAQQEQGWEGMTFRQIIEQVPQQKRQEFQQLFDQLETSVSVFQETNKNAMDTISVHLREIQKIIKTKDPEGRYNQEGDSLHSESPLTNRRV